jgi:hypothetical protein
VAAGLAAASFSAAALADSPFPAAKVSGVFVAAQTVTPTGAVSNFVAPGGKVVFRAYAVDAKKKKVLTAKDVKFFYVKIPNSPNLKLTYDAKAPGANAQQAWSGTWTVPATYPEGVVPFKVLVKTVTKHVGSFEQMPIATARLTVSKAPQDPIGAAGTDRTAPAQAFDASLYVDAVNGTRPVGAAARPIGCTQTNVFRRGEQLVVRSWGVDMSDGSILSTENVREAHWTITGVSTPVVMNWGLHGTADNRVFFWSGAWTIAPDYPLGDSVIKVTYTLESGKVASFEYAVTVIP